MKNACLDGLARSHGIKTKKLTGLSTYNDKYGSGEADIKNKRPDNFAWCKNDKKKRNFWSNMRQIWLKRGNVCLDGLARCHGNKAGKYQSLCQEK
jgi:hypothetical protein